MGNQIFNDEFGRLREIANSFKRPNLWPFLNESKNE